MSVKVLVVDDDVNVREALGQTLELADIEPILTSAFVTAKDYIHADFEGVVLSDIRMPGRDGFFLLDHVRQVDPDLPVVLLTGEGDIPMAVRAMSEGAFGFLEKPCSSSDLLGVIERALKTRGLVIENRRLKTLVETGDPAARMIFGQSRLAEALRARARRVAQLETDVLVSGAPGAGISKVAEVIHLSSSRSKAPFVKLAAAGLSVAALEDALHSAQSGSLFLDEIAHLAADCQLTLYERLEAGAAVRVLAGSCQDLEAAVNEGRFNADLWYHLQVTPVRIPSLADRPEDIPVLFRHYVAQACEQAGMPVPEIGSDVIADLFARDWAGNTRALMSEAMRFALQVDDGTQDAGLGLAEHMAQVERTFLIQALERSGGNATAAAEALHLPRKTFYDKLARHDIRAEDYRID